jgi:hypothetical protein
MGCFGGKNLLFITPQTYADLKIGAYRVAALSLKSVTATGFAVDRQIQIEQLSTMFDIRQGVLHAERPSGSAAGVS